MLKDKIKMLCKVRGTTIMKLENDLHLGSGTVAKWDKAIPKADTLVKVADYFGVSVDYLLGRTDDPRPAVEAANGLSPEEEALVDLFRKLPDDMKKVALGQAKVLSESNKK